MYIKIICTDPIGEFESADVDLEEESEILPAVKSLTQKEFFANPDCPLGLLTDYIRRKAGLCPNDQIDLCTSNGVMLHLNNASPLSRATEFVELEQTYYVLYISPCSNHSLTPSLLLPKGSTLYSDLLLRIKKNIAGSQTSITRNKSSISRTKSSRSTISSGRRSSTRSAK